MYIRIRIQRIIGGQQEKAPIRIEGRLQHFIDKFFENTTTVYTRFLQSHRINKLYTYSMFQIRFLKKKKKKILTFLYGINKCYV